MEWRYHVWRANHEAILKPSSEAQNSLWIKSRTGEDMGQFPQIQLITLSQVLQIVWQEYANGDGRIQAFFSTQKVLTLTAFALSWIIENFW